MIRTSYCPEDLRFIGLAMLGCGLITVGSLIKIPIDPVPFTLQTLAIYILALTQSPKQAFASVICYLLCATAQLPVLGGNANSLWMIGKCGGYLISFPIAAYTIARTRTKQPFIAVIIWGPALIFALGWTWLLPFLGPKEALIKGVFIFIPSEIFKGLAALALVKWRNR